MSNDIILILPYKPLTTDVYKLDGHFVNHTPIVVMQDMKPVFDHGKYVGVQDTIDTVRQRVINDD